MCAVQHKSSAARRITHKGIKTNKLQKIQFLQCQEEKRNLQKIWLHVAQP